MAKKRQVDYYMARVYTVKDAAYELGLLRESMYTYNHRNKERFEQLDRRCSALERRYQHIDTTPDATPKQLDSVKTSISQMRKDIRELSSNHDTLTQDTDELRKRLEGLEQKNTTATDETIQNQQAKMSHLEQEVHRKIDASRKRIERQGNNIQEIQRRIKGLENKYTEIEQATDTRLDDRVKRLEEYCRKLEERCSELENRENGLRRSLERFDGRLIDLSYELNGFKERYEYAKSQKILDYHVFRRVMLHDVIPLTILAVAFYLVSHCIMNWFT